MIDRATTNNIKILVLTDWFINAQYNIAGDN